MTKRTRRKIDAGLKAKIALEALRDDVAQVYEMLSPGERRLAGERISSSRFGVGQALLVAAARWRRRLWPARSMRCALWTRRSRMASA
jgi:hypothetical protein